VELTKLHAKISQLVVEWVFLESLRSLSLDRRKTMIEPDHPRLSIVPQDLSVSAEAPDHRPAELGVVRRRNLHPDVVRLPPRGDHGLAKPEGPCLAAAKHDRPQLLRCRIGEAIARFGRPDIINTDRGSQFTSFACTTH
jgi:hypothetical protein